jgi:hypothetical protein
VVAKPLANSIGSIVSAAPMLNISWVAEEPKMPGVGAISYLLLPGLFLGRDVTATPPGALLVTQ